MQFYPHSLVPPSLNPLSSAREICLSRVDGFNLPYIQNTPGTSFNAFCHFDAAASPGDGGDHGDVPCRFRLMVAMAIQHRDQTKPNPGLGRSFFPFRTADHLARDAEMRYDAIGTDGWTPNAVLSGGLFHCVWFFALVMKLKISTGRDAYRWVLDEGIFD